MRYSRSARREDVPAVGTRVPTGGRRLCRKVLWEGSCGRSLWEVSVGGPSGPMLSGQVAAT
ncbi:hypothetical protein GLE_4095 [Lysobacter enzymogenes]|uniref:Uncharacterized protein n=1 Tax=Lysobacter enzymogenes TaxID=69 RepID=A0A0S2DM77_LYSEN|nr:hypothetical protein GLE_4095 [Lysobacter enzymogenes]